MNRLLLCGLSLATLCPAAVILMISPSSQTIPLGTAASFQINISGLGNGTALGTYDITLGFDPTLLDYSSIVFGSQLDVHGLGDIQSVTPGVGTVEVFELSLDSASDLNALQASSFTLATLTFNPLATGMDSPVTLSVNALGDAFGNSITADLQNGSATINAPSSVAEPSTLAMLCVVGVPLLVILARRSCRRSLGVGLIATTRCRGERRRL